MLALTLSVVALLPQEVVAVDRVGLVEINHVYSQSGDLTFSQLIWWRWDGEDKCFHVRAWRMMKCGEPRPILNHRTGLYVTTWNDQGVLRTVEAESFRETWTQWDVELAERQILPKNERRPLQCQK